MKWQKGYTLVEILVALMIVGLLFGVGYVNFRDFSRRQALIGAGKLLQADIRLAQQQALSGQKPNDDNCKDPNTLGGYYFNLVSTNEYTIYAGCSAGDSTVISKDVTLPGGSSGIQIASYLCPLSVTDVSSLSQCSATPGLIFFRIIGRGTNIPASSNLALVLTQMATNNKYMVIVGSGGEIR